MRTIPSVPVSPRPGPRFAPRPARRPRPWLWITLLAPLMLLGGVGAIAGLGVLYNLTGKEVELAPEERDLVLDIAHLTSWLEGYTPNLQAESLVKRRYIDDSYEIEYVYDAPEDDAAPYLSYSLTFEPSEADAGTTYHSLWGGTRIGFYFFGEAEVQVKEDNELFHWGDESRFGIILAENRPFGNLFVGRKGKRVVYLILSGVCFDEAEGVKSLLTPYLERLEGFTTS